MFNIIKEGKLTEKHIIYKDTCDNCGCIYEFESSDVATEKTPDGYSFWECPYCHIKVSKKLKDLDSRVDEKIIMGNANVKPSYMCECYDFINKRCNGTRERDVCYCYGDRTLCTFYPEKRVSNKVNISNEDTK